MRIRSFLLLFLCQCFVAFGCVNPLAFAGEIVAPTSTVLFEREVEASLTKLGCNSGTCHGSLHGKGGFRLSLRGQDPLLDFYSIAMDLQGRRIDPLDSSQSLILSKPSGDMPHQGGLRLPKDSQYYNALRQWIEQGAKAPTNPDSSNTRTTTNNSGIESVKIVSIQLSPSEIWLRLPIHEHQLSATARWSDGSTSDVTSWVRYECSSIHGATVDEQGKVTVTQSIDTTVSALYLGQHASSRLVFLPEASSNTNASEPSDASEPSEQTNEKNQLDRLVNLRLQKLGIEPEQSAGPEQLVRRLYLTTLGRLPTIQEQDEFLLDATENPLENCVDRLLSDPSYAALWAMKWSDLLRNEPKVMSEEGVGKWHDWLTESIARDKPTNEMVMEMITTLGSTYERPAASFHRTHRDPAAAAESIGQVFLGIRMQCAKCHNHPFDVWTQDDYYGLAAYFSPLERKQIDNMPGDKLDTHIITGDEIISMNPTAAAVLFHPGRSKLIAAKGLNEPVKIAEPESAPKVKDDDPLARLATWIGKDNRQFARNMANRVWAHAMGRGIVDPPDDFRGSNPPSNPELLEYITDAYIEHGYSTRWLMREILTSQTYSRKSVSLPPDSERTESAVANFAGYATRRMMAEVLQDAIRDVSSESIHLKRAVKQEDGKDNKNNKDDETGRMRAVDFPSVSQRNVFLRAFGKPDRLLDCECERSSDLSLRQSLLLVNDASIREQLRNKNGIIARCSAATTESPTPKQIDDAVEQLYRSGLCRSPTEQEWVSLRSYAFGSSNIKDVLEDIAWAIINSKEFLFVR